MSLFKEARAGIDPMVRPQDDLFGHVNGGWLTTTNIPADRPSWGTLAALADRAENQVRDIVEDFTFRGVPGPDADKVAAVYTSFMDQARIEDAGLTPLEPWLAQISAVSTRSDLAAYLGRLLRAGGGGVFGARVAGDGHTGRFRLWITQGGFGLPDAALYHGDRHRRVQEAYLTYLERVLTLLRHPSPTDVARATMALETRLTHRHQARAQSRVALRSLREATLDDLHDLVPEFDFAGWVAALGASESALDGALIWHPDYLSHLNEVLAGTPLPTWRDWLIVKTTRAFISYLPPEFGSANFDFYGRLLSGKQRPRPRWARGVRLVQDAVGDAVGREYVRRQFSPAAKAAAEELVVSLRAAFRRKLTDVGWMSEPTRRRALDKLEGLRSKVGYPEDFRTYHDLDVSASDLLGHATMIAAYNTDGDLSRIGTPVAGPDWVTLPQSVNAHYSPTRNEICVPAALLQPPLFDLAADPAENLGAVGALIGHEMVHAFDDRGAHYDGDGRLRDWWTDQDREAFDRRVRALTCQFDSLAPRDLPEARVNGALTVGENLGDLGGLSVALDAYRHEYLRRGVTETEALAGVRRLLSMWALAWRVMLRPEQLARSLRTDPHAPPDLRANAVRNLDEFHKAFGTRSGDGLWVEPEHRVRIW